jgi:hypothetical protein
MPFVPDKDDKAGLDALDAGQCKYPRHDWVKHQPHQATILHTGVAVLPITMTLLALGRKRSRKSKIDSFSLSHGWVLE